MLVDLDDQQLLLLRYLLQKREQELAPLPGERNARMLARVRATLGALDAKSPEGRSGLVPVAGAGEVTPGL